MPIRFCRASKDLFRRSLHALAGPAFLAAGLFWLTSCAEERITVGINDWPPCQVWQVARQLKVDRSQGIRLKLVRFPSWRSNMEGFYRGNLDISHASYFNVVYYSERGEGGAIGIVADVTLGADGMVLAPAVPDVEALRGRIVGVEVGTDEFYLLYHILRGHDL